MNLATIRKKIKVIPANKQYDNTFYLKTILPLYQYYKSDKEQPFKVMKTENIKNKDSEKPIYSSFKEKLNDVVVYGYLPEEETMTIFYVEKDKNKGLFINAAHQIEWASSFSR